MKKFQHIVSAALLVIAASSMISTTANAQSGSRLCGISLGPMAILVEIKQPGGRNGRKNANNFCTALSTGMAEGLKEKGINTDAVIHYKRTECEAVARNISGGRSQYDICEKMERTNVGNGVNPYTVIFKQGQFEFTRA